MTCCFANCSSSPVSFGTVQSGRGGSLMKEATMSMCEPQGTWESGFSDWLMIAPAGRESARRPTSPRARPVFWRVGPAALTLRPIRFGTVQRLIACSRCRERGTGAVLGTWVAVRSGGFVAVRSGGFEATCSGRFDVLLV